MAERGSTFNFGFLTIHEDHSSFSGGYLIANRWGRPLEFRLSAPVHPNRVQQILYGDTLKPYICADLIGKTLAEKASTEVQLIVTDCADALDLRWQWPTPVVWLAAEGEESSKECSLKTDSGTLFWHQEFPEDGDKVKNWLQEANAIDLAEPFQRIREALGEARNSGAAHRVAA